MPYTVDPTDPNYDRVEDLRSQFGQLRSSRMANETDDQYRARRATLAAKTGVQAFDVRGGPANSFDDNENAVIKAGIPEAGYDLQQGVNSLPQRPQMYAKFGGKEFIGETKPRLGRDAANAILRLSLQKRAAAEAKQAQLDAQAHEEKMAALPFDNQLKLAETKSRLNRGDKVFERELTADDRAREQKIQDDERKQQHDDRFRDLARDEDKYQYEKSQRKTPEQMKAQELLDSQLGQQMVKASVRDPKARAWLKRNAAAAGYGEDAVGDVSPQDREMATDEFLSSRTGTMLMKQFVDRVKPMAGQFTTEAELMNAIKVPLAQVARKAQMYGGSPALAVQEAVARLKEAVPESTGLFSNAPWHSSTQIRGTADEEAGKYGE